MSQEWNHPFISIGEIVKWLFQRLANIPMIMKIYKKSFICSSRKQLPEDLEGVYVQGGVGVVLYVAEDSFGYFVADGAGKGYQH